MIAPQSVNILLVDDQPAKLLSYEVILSELGHTLIKAGSAREALECLLRNEIALVLIDVCMPDLDGFELAKMIREHPRFQRTAIIFVSAIHMTELDLLRGYECGAVDYVPVPVIPELLRAKVKVFTDLYQATRQLEAMNTELERRVAERTAELERANVELERRVEERTREREAALAQLHEIQKLESLGQITGGVAHDFNNLLMVIIGNLHLLRKRMPGDPNLVRLVDGAMQGAERGATLTKRMLAFARRQELKPESVEVSDLVKGMEDMLRRSLGPEIQIGTDFRPDLAPVLADPSQLELALFNLALNARDAMPRGGRLVFSARLTDCDGNQPPELQPGRYVCISVTDTGLGMDEATIRRATEPFFTTKGPGKGTGLGLSMVHGLAGQSGGAMRIVSRLGEGTSVELWLPASDALPAWHGESLRPMVVAPRSFRVLVVDDDPLIGISTAAMLEDLGHTVVQTTSGLNALNVLDTDPMIEVLITDQAMPGITGLELARRIRQERPNLPIILATGYAEVSEGEDLDLPRLSKPYTQAELAEQIARAMAGASGHVPPSASTACA